MLFRIRSTSGSPWITVRVCFLKLLLLCLLPALFVLQGSSFQSSIQKHQNLSVLSIGWLCCCFYIQDQMKGGKDAKRREERERQEREWWGVPNPLGNTASLQGMTVLSGIWLLRLLLQPLLLPPYTCLEPEFSSRGLVEGWMSGDPHSI